MQFFCVRTEAIQRTHQALQQLEGKRSGSCNPSRALRVASLFGHLQWRSRPTGVVRLTVRELAAAWHLQPRLLREDLADLQALGWLNYSSGPFGTTVQLLVANPLEPQPQPPLELPSRPPSEPDDLVEEFARIYNRHRPATWPAYQPRGSVLLSRLKRAIAYAESPEAFWRQSARALEAMPAFWRDTYPKGRSGSECIAALLSADRKAAGLGPEFWHVFCWAAAQGAASAVEGELERARRLFVWDGHQWRGQGMEALKLEPKEKRRLAGLLEAQGEGIAGAAEAQFHG
jgi:hypothetical protein